MIPADVAFAMLINKTTQAYVTNAPTYMTYTELLHVNVSGGIFKKSVNINRSVKVRVADNYSVMQDLPMGAEETGEAFPILAYLDPLSSGFGFKSFANLKKIEIDLFRGTPLTYTIPTPDPTVDIDTPYFTYWVPHYAPDSTDASEHFLFEQTTRFNEYYPTDITVDPVTGLPKHISFNYDDPGLHIQASLNYAVIDGHWVVTDGVLTSTQNAGLTFKSSAELTYQNIAFPTTPPDPRLATEPSPSAAPTTP